MLEAYRTLPLGLRVGLLSLWLLPEVPFAIDDSPAQVIF